ncbi:MAG: DUF2505 domain-containing protein [Beutenbergiaceae bacterium]
MREFRAEIEYPATTEDVAIMLADPQFVKQKVAASKPVDSSVHVQADAAGAFVVTTERELSTAGLPSAAQRLVGQSLRIRLVESWEEQKEPGSRDGTINLDVVGKPAQASGTALLRSAGPTSSRVIYQGTVQARVPLIGPKLEEQAVAQVESVLATERAVALAWLAQR